MKNMGLTRVMAMVFVCMFLCGCRCSKRIPDIEIGKYPSDRIEYDYLYRIEKRGSDKAVYQSYNRLGVDTVINSGKSLFYVVSEDIEDQELTNKYIVYDSGNDKLYESDMNICFDIITSEKDCEELYRRIFGKEYLWSVSRISDDLSYIVVNFFNNGQNRLNLYPVVDYVEN